MWLKNHPAYSQSSLSLGEVVESNCGEESSAVNFRKESNITMYTLWGGGEFLLTSSKFIEWVLMKHTTLETLEIEKLLKDVV